jgi:SAM-dependent methyltransferase
VRNPPRDRGGCVEWNIRQPHCAGRELEQRERVAAGGAVESVGGGVADECGGVFAIETRQSQGRERCIVDEGLLTLPHGGDDGDGIRDEPADCEEQRVSARAVQPVRVVDEHGEGSLLGVRRQQAQRGCSDGEPVLRGGRAERQRPLERRGLRAGDPLQCTQSRPQELQQSREWDSRLRLDPARTEDAHPRVAGVFSGNLEQRRLADPDFAREDENAALIQASVGEQRVERLPLPVAAEQHRPDSRGATRGECSPPRPSVGDDSFTIRKEETMATIEQSPLDMAKLEQFVFKAVDEVGATLNTALVVMGDRLGLYRALSGSGPLTPAELADKTGTTERYVREWLNAQAAGGYVEYDPDSGRYTLPPEQALALTDAESPAYLPGFFQIALGSVLDSPRITDAAKNGDGVGWHEHNHDVFDGCERFFRPGYNANLLSVWLPALDGVVEKLERGASVADVGCGHGSSTILMAKAYPQSTFVGYDYHDGSIETARERAREEGIDNVRFETSPAAGFAGTGYDLVTMFDCLHDMGDPVGAARHVRQALANDGTWMIVEPAAGDRVEDNLNPIGRAYYGFSTLLCTPSSLSQEVGLALGAQAGEARIRDVVTTGGFSKFRRASETPFNLVFEARP